MSILKNNKKEDILRAAYELFIENGYDNTPMKMIAERAGTPQSHIYNFFENKESLFEAVLRMAQDSFLSKMIVVAEECREAPPEEYVTRTIDAIQANRGEAVFIISSALTPKLRAKAEPLLKEYSDEMVGVMSLLFPGVSDELLYKIGNILLAISDSLLIDGNRERAANSAVFAMELFKHYIGNLNR